MLLPKFGGREPVFFFECAVKAGVVAKAVLLIEGSHRRAGKDSVFAGVEPFFKHILVQGNAHAVLKYMGDVVLADIEKVGKCIQAQIILQMVVDIITYIYIQCACVGLGNLMQHLEGEPV